MSSNSNIFDRNENLSYKKQKNKSDILEKNNLKKNNLVENDLKKTNLKKINLKKIDLKKTTLKNFDQDSKYMIKSNIKINNIKEVLVQRQKES